MDRLVRRLAIRLPIKRILPGEWSAMRTPALLTTLLGSCVAACLHDPVSGVGGMNHFMLPRSKGLEPSPARFGSYAMAVLINDLIELGARHDRLVAKVFGAANVMPALSTSIGANNASFVLKFLAEAGIPVACAELGGDTAHQVVFNPFTGQTWHRRLHREAVVDVAAGLGST